MDDVVEPVDAAYGKGVEEKASGKESRGAKRFVIVVEPLRALERPRERRRNLGQHRPGTIL